MTKAFSKTLFTGILLLSLFSQVSHAKKIDIRKYFIGTYQVDGFNTTEVQHYQAKAIIRLNEGHGLRIEIQHDKNSGLGTYYGFFSDTNKRTLKLDYKNVGGHPFSATCNYENSADNFPKFICKGDLQGNVGFDGVFVIHKVWE